MSDNTRIQWADATWNVVNGCTKVSPGCAYCYAERLDRRFRGKSFIPWEVNARLEVHPERLDKPLHWKRPRRVFVNSMSDMFHEDIPVDIMKRMFDVMERATQHTFIILTKRPERALLAEQWWGANWWWPSNVQLLVSTENQHFLDERVAILAQIPAALKGISAEPLLGPLDIRPWLGYRGGVNAADGEYDEGEAPVIQWVIAGGESGGPERRSLVENVGGAFVPKDEAWDWALSLRDQCAKAGVPFFWKQWGGPRPDSGGRLLAGKLEDGFPDEVKSPQLF